MLIVKKYIFLLAFIFIALVGSTQNSYNNRIQLNEKLEYKIKYGWLKIGDAELYTDEKLHIINGQPHFLLKFDLKTVPWLRIFANVDLNFESYINAITYQPHHATRSVKAGKKSNVQFDEFEFSDSVYVKTLRAETQETRKHGYAFDGVAFTDALSAYLYIRAQELNLDKDEQARLYIANHLYDFKMTPDLDFREKSQKSYELIFPPIKEFPRDKRNFVTLDEQTNIPIEIKLATDNGNFHFVLDSK